MLTALLNSFNIDSHQYTPSSEYVVSIVHTDSPDSQKLLQYGRPFSGNFLTLHEEEFPLQVSLTKSEPKFCTTGPTVRDAADEASEKQHGSISESTGRTGRTHKN